MKEILNNNSESSKLNVDLLHAVNQVYFAQEEQVQRNRLCSSRTTVYQLKKKRFVRENHNLLTNNEEVENGTENEEVNLKEQRLKARNGSTKFMITDSMLL